MIARHGFTAVILIILSSAPVSGETNNRFDDVFGSEPEAPAAAAPGPPAATSAPPAQASPAKVVAPEAFPLPRARPAKTGTTQELRNRNLCITDVLQATVEDEQGVPFQVTVCKVKPSGNVAEYQAWCSGDQSMIVTKAKMKMLKRVCAERGGYAPPQLPTASASGSGPAPASAPAAAATEPAGGH